MTPTSLLDALRTRGVLLAVDGNALTLNAPKGALTNDLLQVIPQHKTELLPLLAQSTPAHDASLIEHSQQEGCTHQEHFSPTPTDGPTRQCRHCPHVWQVPCACGTASWKPDAHWGPDGAGVVRWTCTSCGASYAPDPREDESYE